MNKAFSDADLGLVANAILSACDKLDGLEDGIIGDFTACKSSIVRLQAGGFDV